MTKKLLIPLFLCFINAYNLNSQAKPDYREIFLEAESYFLFEEYNEALPLYLRLNEKYPDNNNINYKIGVCYLNDSYEKQKSIDYLERAVTDIDLHYKENNYKETSAPLETLFHLGTAYRINNQIDKAIETYKKFREQSDPEIYDHQLVDEQINACNYAIDLKSRPIDIDIINVGDRINTRFSDINPVVSGDETKIVYIQRQQFYDAVFFSEKVDGVWSYPRNIIPELGVDEDAYPTSLSYDGNTLLIYRSDNFIGDLYSSTYSDGTWSKLVKLNDNINTKYWESHACMTRNSDTLYFTSNRKGGYGGLDIYYSTKDAENQWVNPVNLGNVINTKYNEETPFITWDGKTLYFSSYGHYNMGGYDIFYASLLDDGTWAVPINAGFPINTTEDDIFFNPVENGIFAYFPRFLEESLGGTDIYKIEIYSGTHPRKFRIRGILSYQGEGAVSNPVTIRIIDELSHDFIGIAEVNPATGKFSFEVPAGQYELVVDGKDIQTDTSSLVIPKEFRGKEIDMENAIEVALLEKPEEITQPKIVDKIRLADSIIYVSRADAIKIDMTLERNSRLFVDIMHGSLYAGTDSFNIEKRRFTYSYKPVQGKNKLKFKLVDEEGNLSFKDVVVIYTPAKKTPLIRKKEPAKKETATQKVIDQEKLPSKDQIIEQFQTSYINQYIDQLKYLTDNQALINTLSTLDPQKEGITSLQELYDYLIANTEAVGYRAGDVNNLFTKLSLRTELINLLENLKKLSSGNLRLTLEDLNPEKEKLRNPNDLMNWLMNNSQKYGYSESDALNLLFEYLKKEDINEIMKLLIGTSSGPLQELLSRLNLETSGIDNINELFDYLLAQAKYNNYTESDVIRLFLNLLNVMEKQELIKKIEPSQVQVIQTTNEKGSRLIYYFAGAGLLIILLIIIFLIRKKDNKKKQE